jgi:hypothetical protein
VANPGLIKLNALNEGTMLKRPGMHTTLCWPFLPAVENTPSGHKGKSAEK